MNGTRSGATVLRWMLLVILIGASLTWPPGAMAAQDSGLPEPTAVEDTGSSGEAVPVESEQPVATFAPNESPTPAPEPTTEPTTTEAPLPTATSEPAPTEVFPTPDVTQPSVAETPTLQPESGELGPAETVETATLHVRTVDHTGAPVLNAMYVAYRDLGGGSVAETVGWAWDSDPSDGIATFVGLPTFPIVVRQYAVPRGYLAAPELLSFTLAAGEEQTIEVTSPLGGKVTVYALDENNNPRPDGCYTAYINDNGSRGAGVRSDCDHFSGPNDGTTVIDGLPAGSYVLGSNSLDPTYMPGPDVPFTVELGGAAEVTVQFVPKGTIVIHKRNEANEPLAGACFLAYVDEGGGQHSDSAVAGRCDYDDGAGDGLITFPAPPGNLVIVESQAPYGYVPAPDVLVSIESLETIELTVVDPLASTLIVSVTDLWGTPFAPACLELFFANPDGTRGPYASVGCTYHFGEFNKVRFGPLQPGQYLIAGSSVNTGMYLNTDVPVEVGLSEATEITVKFNGPAPELAARPVVASLTPTSAVIYWETNQPTVGAVDYGLTTNLGRLRPITAGPESSVQRVVLSPLEPNRTYYFRVRGTNPNGTVSAGLYSFRTPASTAMATLEITKTNSDGSRILAGACFELYRNAGGGALGTFIRYACDKFDDTPDDGKLTFSGLAAGSYVLVEIASPTGYALGSNVLISLNAGETRQLAVKNSRGGAVLTIETYVHTGSSDAPRVPGACYDVYKNVNGAVGNYVTFGCDDTDGLDGITTIRALRTGRYYVRQSYTPQGHLPSTYFEITITSGQTTASHTDILTAISDPGNAVLRTVDSAGNVLVGACFALYQITTGLDPFLRSACDSDDGRLDGLTVFVALPNNRYAAYQYVAPTGYQIGTRVGFAKTDGVLRTITVVQIPGGVRVRVTTLNGSTTGVLPGACYLLVKPSGGDGSIVTGACDTSGDGVIILTGVPTGTYQLVQSSTPAGYQRPPNRNITVGTADTSTRIRTYPG